MVKPISKQYKRKGSYIRKWAEWMESPAYRDLRPPARCLLDEFQLIYRPGRNGHLSIGTRRAAKLLCVSENTTKNAFYELVEHGFLALSKGEIFTQRMAREWRLTIEPCNNHEPTDDWRRWEHGKPVAIIKKKRGGQKQGQNCPKNGGKLPQKQGQSAIEDQTEVNTSSIIQ